MSEQNIALNRPTSASSFVKPYESGRAVNGASGSTTPTSRWLCNSLPGWFVVDLGLNGSYTYWINRWVLRHMTVAGWKSPDYNMSDYKLQGSNGNNTWQDIDNVVGNTTNITDRTFIAVSYRYVRLYVTNGLRCNTKMASAMELEVYQSPPLSAYLQTSTGLNLSSGDLSPAFVNNVFNYTTPDVANSITSVTVKPAAEDSRATIKVNGVIVKSGDTTNVALNVGSNAISVQVIAADGRTTNTYTVTVIRSEALALSGLTINPGTLNETFSSSTFAYTANEGYDIDSITVIPSINSTDATITVNGETVASGTASRAISLNVGKGNVIKVVVTNGTFTNEYTITVTKAPNLYLTTVKLNYTGNRYTSTNTISMDHNNLTYNTNVAPAATQVAITPVTEDSAVSINVNGQVLTSGGASQKISLSTANTQIPISVSYRGIAGSRDYTITITKS